MPLDNMERLRFSFAQKARQLFRLHHRTSAYGPDRFLVNSLAGFNFSRPLTLEFPSNQRLTGKVKRGGGAFYKTADSRWEEAF